MRASAEIVQAPFGDFDQQVVMAGGMDHLQERLGHDQTTVGVVDPSSPLAPLNVVYIDPHIVRDGLVKTVHWVG